MSYFGSSGEFGAWLQNPQYGGPGQNTGFWFGDDPEKGVEGTPLTEEMGPFGGWYEPGKGWENIRGWADPDSQFSDELKRRGKYNRWGANQERLYGKKKKKLDLSGILGAMRDRGIKGGDVPEEWNQDAANVPKNTIDPMAVINSAKPAIMEEMERNMAAGAQRLGKTGALMGSGYTKEIGKSARKASNDIASKTLDTLFQAGEAQAGREHEAQQRGYDRSLDSWGKHGDWEFEAGREYWDRIPMMINLITSLSGEDYEFDPNDLMSLFG